MLPKQWPAAVVCLSLGSTAAGTGRVVVSEIMYNPASSERRGETEWIEIANVGDEPVEMLNWKLDDEDEKGRANWAPFTCTLKPGQVAVLINGGSVDEQKFRQAWTTPGSAPGTAPGTVAGNGTGENARAADRSAGALPKNSTPTANPYGTEDTPPSGHWLVIPIKWGGLANSASAENEILTLVDATGEVICTVNFENGGDWPRCTGLGGPSIWLTESGADEIDNGKLWRLSEAGVHGARKCEKMGVFGGADIGSPGHVPGLKSMPAEGPPADGDAKESNRSAKNDDTIDY